VRTDEAMLAILAMVLAMPVSSFAVTITSAFAQDDPYSEEYMQQHDGGDRAEYLQEMKSNDPWFYVPPVNDASLSTSPSHTTSMDNNLPTK
jgi:hypothetical protein